MSNEPFTPSTESIETAWVIMCQQSRISTQPPESELIAEFARFINRIRADAWNEGYTAGSEDSAVWEDVKNGYRDSHEDTPNPYRDNT